MIAFDYRAPAWLPGGNAQTIWAAKLAKRFDGPQPAFARERWNTPDGDFVDVDHLLVAQAWGAGQPVPVARPAQHLVLFHGLEGSSQSAYAQAFAHCARERGWAFSVPHFRGCSGELNLAPRAYHSGDHAEIGWMLERLALRHGAPLLVVGVSLGGNALLRWGQEQGAVARAQVAALASVCSPIDLAAAGRSIDQGFNLAVYARMFLRTMRPRALAKLAQFPGLFDRERVADARTLYAFDDAFTAPLHGFAGADDYYARASAAPRLGELRVPSLLLHAGNDPFVPAASLPAAQQAYPGGQVHFWRPAQGGHVGFPQALGGVAAIGRAHVMAMPGAVCDWLASQC